MLDSSPTGDARGSDGSTKVRIGVYRHGRSMTRQIMRKNNNIRIASKVILAVFFVSFSVIGAAQKLVDYSKPSSHFPGLIGPYLAHQVPAPSFGNTPRIETLLRDGKLKLSLSD